MKLTPRQAQVLRSYFRAEKFASEPSVAVEIRRLTGHAHGMALWGLKRVLSQLRLAGLITQEGASLAVQLTQKGREEAQT